VLDEKHVLFDSRIHDPYTLAVVTNRRSALRAQANGELAWAVVHPPREGGSLWPWHLDSSALGEVYNKTSEVECVADWEAVVAGPELPTDEASSYVKWAALWHYAAAAHGNATSTGADSAGADEIKAGDGKSESEAAFLPAAPAAPLSVASVLALPLADVDGHPLLAEVANSALGVRGWAGKNGGGAPHEGGFLSVVCFQVLWDAACVKAMPSIEELAPSFPAARFVLVRADRTGVDSISRSHKVTAFPTVLLLRGGTELARLEGPDRAAGRLAELLRSAVTAEDVAVAGQLRSFELEQAGGGADEDEEDDELQWTWDPEFASEDVKVLNYGTVVALLKEDANGDGEPGVWQFKGGEDWEDLDASLQGALERDYRSGRLYVEHSITAVGPSEGVQVALQTRTHKVAFDAVTGMACSFSSNPYDELECRRKGPRFVVTGDDKYCSEQQKAADKFELSWKAAAAKRREEADLLNVGKDLQGVRGTNAFVEESGVHKWTIKFNHEPARLGGGDAVGIASDVAEHFGPLAYPVLGHRGGHSLGLYANGDLVFDDRVIATLTGPPRKGPLALGSEGSSTGGADAEGPSALDGDESDLEADDVQPRCCNDHPWMKSEVENYYCQRCYTRGTGGKLPFSCGFCRDGFCQECFDLEFKKLNKKPGDGDAKKKKEKKKKRRGSSDEEEDEDDSSQSSKEEDEEEEKEEEQEEKDQPEEPPEKIEEADGEGSEAQEKKYRLKAKEVGLSEEEVEQRITKAVAELQAAKSKPQTAHPADTAALPPVIAPMVETETVAGAELAADSFSAAAASVEEKGDAPPGTADGAPTAAADGVAADGGAAATSADVDWKALLAALPKGKQQLNLAAYVPPEPEVAPAKLFGRGSKVTLTLDTDKEGGVLSFEVDGVPLAAADGTARLTQVFAMLQATQLYPCLNTCPLDPLPPFLAAEPPEAELAAAKGSGKEKQESDEARAKREKAKIDRAEICDLARKCRQPYGDIAKLSAAQRSTLAALVDKVLRRRVPNVQLILGEDEAVALEKARAEAEANDKEAKEAAANDKEDDAVAADVGGGAATAAAGAASEGGAPDEPMESVWWMYETQEGWVCHTRETSTAIEEALRGGRAEASVTLGTELFVVQVAKGSDGKGPCQTSEEGAVTRVRRHVVGPGLQGQWEMLSVKFAPPMAMSGQAALGVLEKLWASSDDLAGRTHGLGFLFLYNLLQGATRVTCISAGGGGGYGGFAGYGGRSDFGKNDGHRFAVLAAQLFSDKHKRSLLASCVHVLARNRHVCVRMPKLRDTRKSRQSPLFNGWCDEAEPQSPLADLFAKLVPAMQRLKRQRGALRYPPKPPHPELPALPLEAPTALGAALPKPAHHLDTSGGSNASGNGSGSSSSGSLEAVRAQLSDTSCSARTVRPLGGDEILALAAEVRFPLGGERGSRPPPMVLEDEAALELVARACAEAGQLLVVAFSADWCGACQQLAPVFRALARRLPVATFAKVDCDESEAAARRFRVKALPTVLFLRGGATAAHVVGRLEGGGADFSAAFLKLLQPLCSASDLAVLRAASRPEAPSPAVARSLAVDAAELHTLAVAPLGALSRFVATSTRLERGLAPVAGEMTALGDVGGHEAATTAVASQMLSRMQQDVAAFASAANSERAAKVAGLADGDLAAFFANAPGADAALAAAAGTLRTLAAELAALRDGDARAIDAAVPLLKQAANFVDVESHAHGSAARRDRVQFQLRRCARQAPEVWMEFLFGSLLSSQGAADLRKLNPYLSPRTRTAAWPPPPLWPASSPPRRTRRQAPRARPRAPRSCPSWRKRRATSAAAFRRRGTSWKAAATAAQRTAAALRLTPAFSCSSSFGTCSCAGPK
jgi:thiol-disulfide isomerase/thioredoxin